MSALTPSLLFRHEKPKGISAFPQVPLRFFDIAAAASVGLLEMTASVTGRRRQNENDGPSTG